MARYRFDWANGYVDYRDVPEGRPTWNRALNARVDRLSSYIKDCEDLASNVRVELPAIQIVTFERCVFLDGSVRYKEKP